MPWALFHSLPTMEGIPVGPPHEEDCPRDMARCDAFIHMDVVEEEERTAELRVGGGRALAWLGMAWRCLHKRRTRTPAPPAVLLQYELPRKLLGCYFLHVEFFFLVVPGPMSCSVLLACRSCRRCKRSKYSFFFLTKFFFTFRNTEVEPTYVAVNSRTTCSVSMSLGGSLEWFH
jgi:hypothetical protein